MFRDLENRILTLIQIWKYQSHKRTAVTLRQAPQHKEHDLQTMPEETCRIEDVKAKAEVIAMTPALVQFERMNMVDHLEMITDQEDRIDQLHHLEIFVSTMVKMIMDMIEEVVTRMTVTPNAGVDHAHRLTEEIMEDIVQEALAQERVKQLRMQTFRHLGERHMMFLTSRSF